MLRKIASYFLVALAMPAFAAPNTPDEAMQDTTLLGEITVTAIKQGILSNDAVASTVVGRSELEKLNIVSVKGLSDVVPNFYIPDYGSRMTSSIYVRGIGARIDQPAVGLCVDNVPFLNKDAYDFDLSDIVKVEMLRGPQSTLYGRNTMGGLINVSTLSPFNYSGVRMMAEYGSANSWRAAAGWYGKVSETVGLSANVQYNSTDGFFNNSFNGKKCDWEHQFMARVKTEWHPSAHFRLVNTLSASHMRQGGYPYQSVTSGKIEYNDTCFYRRTLVNDGLTINCKVANVSLTSISSFQYLNDNMTLDQDFLPVDYFTLTQARHEAGLTQDIVAKSMVGQNYSWLVGAFGFYRHTSMNAPVTFFDYGISQLIEQHRNDVNPYYPVRWTAREFTLGSRFTNPVYGLALYHQSKYDLDNWHFTLGLRLDYEHVALRYRSDCDTEYDIFKLESNGSYSHYRHVPVVIDETGRLSKSYVEFLPKFSVLYDLPIPDASANLYASVAKGYKAGGYNTQMFSDVLQQRLMAQMGVGMQYDVDDIVSYRPEKSWNFEVGFHGDFLADLLHIEASVFYIDCRDQQLTVFPNGSTTGRIMTNAGKTRSYGAEVSATARLFDRFTLRSSYGYTNARFTRFFNGQNDYSGKYVPYVPSHTLFAGVDYSIPLSLKWLKTLVIDVNTRGVGSIHWNETNTLQQNFYALLGASATFASDKWSLQLWGENLTDTKYYTFYFMSIGNEFVQRARPARWGVTLRVNI